jgi:hypothetical protein
MGLARCGGENLRVVPGVVGNCVQNAKCESGVCPKSLPFVEICSVSLGLLGTVVEVDNRPIMTIAQ